MCIYVLKHIKHICMYVIVYMCFLIFPSGAYIGFLIRIFKVFFVVCFLFFAKVDQMSQSALTWGDSDECVLTADLETGDSDCPPENYTQESTLEVLVLSG